MNFKKQMLVYRPAPLSPSPQVSKMAEDGEISAVVIDNGSGMVKASPYAAKISFKFLPLLLVSTGSTHPTQPLNHI